METDPPGIGREVLDMVRSLSSSGFGLLVFLVGASLSAQDAFIRGDCNADGRGGCDITDPIFLLLHLFSGGEAPPCGDACDANDDGGLDIGDAVYELSYCFLSAPAPPAPHPACGADPTADELACAAFPSCRGGDCAPQDARGVGACLAIVGIFWDGSRCRWHSGCSCEGADCDQGYESLESCYADHAGCSSAGDPMDARAVGACRQVLGFAWTGRACRILSGCECEGEDCGRLYASEDDCRAGVVGCPPICEAMAVEPVGLCEKILGWRWDGTGCGPLVGCECAGAECDALFAGPDECAAAHAGCP
jgi:hypothetical protein